MAERADDHKRSQPVTPDPPPPSESPGPVAPIDPEHPPLRVWLEATRLSNLPTVFSNVLVGLVLGFLILGETLRRLGGGMRVPADHVLLWDVFIDGGWLVMLGAACLYAAGMLLNDVHDAPYDRERRPERPIPSGRLSRRTATIAVVAFSLIGVLLIGALGPWPLLAAALLGTAIAGYNALHRRFAAAVPLMGLCRALLYMLGASLSISTAAVILPAAQLDAFWLVFWRVTLPLAAIVLLYVTGLTYIARRENDATLNRREALLAWALPVLAASGMLWVIPNTGVLVALAAVIGVAMLLWLGWCAQQATGDPPRTKQAVMGWLAGLCLIDAYFLALMGRPAFVAAALVCFAATVLWQRRVMGT